MRVPSPGDLTAKLPGGTCINISKAPFNTGIENPVLGKIGKD